MKCVCGTEFCFKCGEFSHYPASCKQKQEFLHLIGREDKSIAWINTNAKLCPFCHSAVQRTMGCNYMKCFYPCNKAFCYECEEPWETHNLGHTHDSHTRGTQKKDGIRETINIYFRKY